MQTNLGCCPLNRLQLAVLSEHAAPYKVDPSASYTVPSCQEWVPACKEQQGTPTPASPGTGTEPLPVLSAMGAPRPAVRLPALLLLLVASAWAREFGAWGGFGGTVYTRAGRIQVPANEKPGVGTTWAWSPRANGDIIAGTQRAPILGVPGKHWVPTTLQKISTQCRFCRGGNWGKLGEIGKFENWGNFGRELKRNCFLFLTEEVLGNVNPSCPSKENSPWGGNGRKGPLDRQTARETDTHQSSP